MIGIGRLLENTPKALLNKYLNNYYMDALEHLYMKIRYEKSKITNCENEIKNTTDPALIQAYTTIKTYHTTKVAELVAEANAALLLAINPK